MADWPIKVDTTQAGAYKIFFKAADTLDHTSSFTYAWEKVECIAGNVENPSFTDGTKTRTCGNNNEWPNWIITCTDSSSQIVKTDKSGCISNACDPVVTHGVGKITIEGGACQVSSCILGYYKDPDAKK